MKSAWLRDISAYGFQLTVGLGENRPAFLLTYNTRGFDDGETFGFLLSGKGLPVNNGVIHQSLPTLFERGIVFFLQGVISVNRVVDFIAFFFWNELIWIHHAAEIVGVGCALKMLFKSVFLFLRYF